VLLGESDVSVCGENAISGEVVWSICNLEEGSEGRVRNDMWMPKGSKTEERDNIWRMKRGNETNESKPRSRHAKIDVLGY
jgi:hypothetical protein